MLRYHVVLGLVGLTACGTEDVASVDTAPESAAPMIQGADNRTEIEYVSDPVIRDQASAVVSIWSRVSITDNGNGSSTVDTHPYGTYNSMCPGSAFYNEGKGMGFCTGFIVGPDLVATARHCALDAPMEIYRYVIGFQTTNGVTPTQVYNSQIYRPVQVIAAGDQVAGGDWALVRVDRPFGEYQTTLPVRLSGQPHQWDNVGVIGYPKGLPNKFSGGAQIFSIVPSVIYSTLDTFAGNSGSPLINTDTHVVEGVFYEGGTDYDWDPNYYCYRDHVCEPGVWCSEASAPIDGLAGWVRPMGTSISSSPFGTVITNSAPSAVYFPQNGNTYVFARDYYGYPEYRIRVNTFDGNGNVSSYYWTEWRSIPTVSTSTSATPYPVIYNGRLYLFMRGPGGVVYMNSMDSANNWAGWSVVDGAQQVIDAPTAGVYGAYGQLVLTVRTAGNNILEKRMNSNGTWTAWKTIVGQTLSPITHLASGGNLYRFMRGTDNRIYYGQMYSWWGDRWSGWSELPGGGATLSEPVAVNIGGYMHVFVRGTDNGFWANHVVNGSWTGWEYWGGWNAIMSAPATVAFGNSWKLYSQGYDRGVYEYGP